jgi:hypothetical protein
MKNLYIVTILLSCLITAKSFASEGTETHGGDPLLESARPYINFHKINRAAKILYESVIKSKSSISEVFIAEMNYLLECKKFFRLDGIVVVVDGRTKLPVDMRKLTTLGAMTYAERGAPIFFSSARLRKYNDLRFTTLLAHEVLHHVLPASLTEDEVFVELLAEALAQGRTSEALERALQIGTYDHSNQN